MKRSSLTLKIFSATLAVFLLLSNSVFAHALETNFWKERHRVIARSEATKQSLLQENSSPSSEIATSPTTLLAMTPVSGNPLQILNTLPSPLTQTLKSAISKQIEKEIPRNLASQFAPIFNALPSQYGTVRKVSLPSNKRINKTIIHIQDIHLNAEAQENIGKAVEELMKEKSVGLVGLEGEFKPIDLSRFRAFPDKQAIQSVADYLLEQNRISGPVHAAFVSPSSVPPIIGVDEQAHYNANVRAYQESALLVKDYKKKLADLEMAVMRAKKSSFNLSLRAFDLKVSDYRENKISLGEYVSELAKKTLDVPTNVDIFLEAYKSETSINFSQVEAERTALLTELLKKLDKPQTSELLNTSVAYRLGNIRHSDFYEYLKNLCSKNGIRLSQYKAMDSYIQYVLLSDAINPDKLFKELNEMEKEAFASLAVTPQEKSLVEESKYLHLVGKLLDFALTPDEWNEYRRGAARCAQKPGNSQLGVACYAPTLKSFESFYEEAEIRNHAITENLLKAMDKNNTSVAVLVTGGFHSPGIDQLMQEAGVTTITYTPKITKVESEDGGTKYLSIFTQQKTPLDKLFAGEKLFMAPCQQINRQTVASAVALRMEAANPTQAFGSKANEVIAALTGDISPDRPVVTRDISGGSEMPTPRGVLRMLLSPAGVITSLTLSPAGIYFLSHSLAAQTINWSALFPIAIWSGIILIAVLAFFYINRGRENQNFAKTRWIGAGWTALAVQVSMLMVAARIGFAAPLLPGEQKQIPLVFQTFEKKLSDEEITAISGKEFLWIPIRIERAGVFPSRIDFVIDGAEKVIGFAEYVEAKEGAPAKWRTFGASSNILLIPTATWMIDSVSDPNRAEKKGVELKLRLPPKIGSLHSVKVTVGNTSDVLNNVSFRAGNSKNLTQPRSFLIERTGLSYAPGYKGERRPSAKQNEIGGSPTNTDHTVSIAKSGMKANSKTSADKNEDKVNPAFWPFIAALFGAIGLLLFFHKKNVRVIAGTSLVGFFLGAGAMADVISQPGSMDVLANATTKALEQFDPAAPMTGLSNAIEFIDFQRNPTNFPPRVSSNPLPPAYYVPPGLRNYAINGNQKVVIDQGVSCYGTSLSVLAKLKTGIPKDLMDAEQMLLRYAIGKYGDMELKAYPQGSLNSNSFNPFTIDTAYRFSTTRKTGSWDPSWVYWDLNTGENAWLLLATSEYVQVKKRLGQVPTPFIVNLGNSVANAMLLLQTPEGAIRFGPKRQNDTDLSLWNLISAEGEESAFSALMAWSRASNNVTYAVAAEKIWIWLTAAPVYVFRNGRYVSQQGMLYRDVISQTYYFYSGAQYDQKLGRWIADESYSLDAAATWAINSFGVDRLKAEYGPRIALDLLETARSKTGRNNLTGPVAPEDRLDGYDFSPTFNGGNPVGPRTWLISPEWSDENNLTETIDDALRDVSFGLENVSLNEVVALTRDYYTVRNNLDTTNGLPYAYGPGLLSPRRADTGFNNAPLNRSVRGITSLRRFLGNPQVQVRQTNSTLRASSFGRFLETEEKRLSDYGFLVSYSQGTKNGSLSHWRTNAQGGTVYVSGVNTGSSVAFHGLTKTSVGTTNSQYFNFGPTETTVRVNRNGQETSWTFVGANPLGQIVVNHNSDGGNTIHLGLSDAFLTQLRDNLPAALFTDGPIKIWNLPSANRMAGVAGGVTVLGGLGAAASGRRKPKLKEAASADFEPFRSIPEKLLEKVRKRIVPILIEEGILKELELNDLFINIHSAGEKKSIAAFFRGAEIEDLYRIYEYDFLDITKSESDFRQAVRMQMFIRGVKFKEVDYRQAETPLITLLNVDSFHYGAYPRNISILIKAGFDTVGKFNSASIKELIEVPDIGKTTIQELRNFFSQYGWAQPNMLDPNTDVGELVFNFVLNKEEFTSLYEKLKLEEIDKIGDIIKMGRSAFIDQTKGNFHRRIRMWEALLPLEASGDPNVLTTQATNLGELFLESKIDFREKIKVLVLFKIRGITTADQVLARGVDGLEKIGIQQATAQELINVFSQSVPESKSLPTSDLVQSRIELKDILVRPIEDLRFSWVEQPVISDLGKSWLLITIGDLYSIRGKLHGYLSSIQVSHLSSNQLQLINSILRKLDLYLENQGWPHVKVNLPPEILSKPIQDLEGLLIPVRAKNVFALIGIENLETFLNFTPRELFKYQNFGTESLTDFLDSLEVYLQNQKNVDPHIKIDRGNNSLRLIECLRIEPEKSLTHQSPLTQIITLFIPLAVLKLASLSGAAVLDGANHFVFDPNVGVKTIQISLACGLFFAVLIFVLMNQNQSRPFPQMVFQFLRGFNWNQSSPAVMQYLTHMMKKKGETSNGSDISAIQTSLESYTPESHVDNLHLSIPAKFAKKFRKFIAQIGLIPKLELEDLFQYINSPDKKKSLKALFRRREITTIEDFRNLYRSEFLDKTKGEDDYRRILAQQMFIRSVKFKPVDFRQADIPLQFLLNVDAFRGRHGTRIRALEDAGIDTIGKFNDAPLEKLLNIQKVGVTGIRNIREFFYGHGWSKPNFLDPTTAVAELIFPFIPGKLDFERIQADFKTEGIENIGDIVKKGQRAFVVGPGRSQRLREKMWKLLIPLEASGYPNTTTRPTELADLFLGSKIDLQEQVRVISLLGKNGISTEAQVRALSVTDFEKLDIDRLTIQELQKYLSPSVSEPTPPLPQRDPAEIKLEEVLQKPIKELGLSVEERQFISINESVSIDYLFSMRGLMQLRFGHEGTDRLINSILRKLDNYLQNQGMAVVQVNLSPEILTHSTLNFLLKVSDRAKWTLLTRAANIFRSNIEIENIETLLNYSPKGLLKIDKFGKGTLKFVLDELEDYLQNNVDRRITIDRGNNSLRLIECLRIDPDKSLTAVNSPLTQIIAVLVPLATLKLASVAMAVSGMDGGVNQVSPSNPIWPYFAVGIGVVILGILFRRFVITRADEALVDSIIPPHENEIAPAEHLGKLVHELERMQNPDFFRSSPKSLTALNQAIAIISNTAEQMEKSSKSPSINSLKSWLQIRMDLVKAVRILKKLANKHPNLFGLKFGVRAQPNLPTITGGTEIPKRPMVSLDFKKLNEILPKNLPVVRHPFGEGSRFVAYSPDGQWLAAAEGQAGKYGIFLLNRSNSQTKVLVGHTQDIRSLVFFPHGQKLVSGSNDRSIKIWDLTHSPDEELILNISGSTTRLRSVVISPDGKTLVAADEAYKGRLWDLSLTNKKETVRTFEPMYDLSLSRDGKTLVSMWGRKGRIWDLSRPIGHDLQGFLWTSGDVVSHAFSPDGKTLALGLESGSIELHDLTKPEIKTLIRKLDVPLGTGLVLSLAFHPSGEMLASGTSNGKVNLFDLTGQLPRRGYFKTLEVGDNKINNVWSVAFSPDGRKLTAASQLESLLEWDLPVVEPSLNSEKLINPTPQKKGLAGMALTLSGLVMTLFGVATHAAGVTDGIKEIFRPEHSDLYYFFQDYGPDILCVVAVVSIIVWLIGKGGGGKWFGGFGGRGEGGGFGGGMEGAVTVRVDSVPNVQLQEAHENKKTSWWRRLWILWQQPNNEPDVDPAKVFGVQGASYIQKALAWLKENESGYYQSLANLLKKSEVNNAALESLSLELRNNVYPKILHNNALTLMSHYLPELMNAMWRSAPEEIAALRKLIHGGNWTSFSNPFSGLFSGAISSLREFNPFRFPNYLGLFALPLLITSTLATFLLLAGQSTSAQTIISSHRESINEQFQSPPMSITKLPDGKFNQSSGQDEAHNKTIGEMGKAIGEVSVLFERGELNAKALGGFLGRIAGGELESSLTGKPVVGFEALSAEDQAQVLKVANQYLKDHGGELQPKSRDEVWNDLLPMATREGMDGKNDRVFVLAPEQFSEFVDGIVKMNNNPTENQQIFRPAMSEDESAQLKDLFIQAGLSGGMPDFVKPLVSKSGFSRNGTTDIFAIKDLLESRGELGRSTIGLPNNIGDLSRYAALFGSVQFALMENMFNWKDLDRNLLKLIGVIAQVIAIGA